MLTVMRLMGWYTAGILFTIVTVLACCLIIIKVKYRLMGVALYYVTIKQKKFDLMLVPRGKVKGTPQRIQFTQKRKLLDVPNFTAF